jgi:hypothetical protein
MTLLRTELGVRNLPRDVVIASEHASQSLRSRQTGSGNLLFSLGLEVPAADQWKDLGKTNPQSSRDILIHQLS